MLDYFGLKCFVINKIGITNVPVIIFVDMNWKILYVMKYEYINNKEEQSWFNRKKCTTNSYFKKFSVSKEV